MGKGLTLGRGVTSVDGSLFVRGFNTPFPVLNTLNVMFTPLNEDLNIPVDVFILDVFF